MTMTTMTEVRGRRLGGREIQMVRSKKRSVLQFFFLHFFQVVRAEAVATEEGSCYFPLDYITSYSIRTKNSNMYIMTCSNTYAPSCLYIPYKAEHLSMHLELCMYIE